MTRKFMTLAAAATLAFGAMAPVAQARDDHWGGGWSGHHDGGRGNWNGYRGGRYRYYGGGRYYGYGNDNAVAAGVVGLILGLAVGSAVNAPRRDGGCYNNCAPPPPQYQGYDPGSAYQQDYGTAPPKEGGYPQSRQCTRQGRQWDRYANRYVSADVPC